jgi:hypothetical protein
LAVGFFSSVLFKIQQWFTCNNLAMVKIFNFEVYFDEEVGTWWCQCDALHVATEASTYEALVARAKLITPEIARDNGVNLARAQLRFEYLVPA